MGKHSSFRFKAILILLSVSVLPILALFLFNFRVTGRIYSEQLKEEGRRETLKAADEFEGALNQMDSVLTSLIFSTYEDQSVLLDISSMERYGSMPTSSERLAESRAFDDLASNLTSTNNYIDGVYIFNEDGYTYQFMKNQELWLEKDYLEAKWYQNIIAAVGYNSISFVPSNAQGGESVVIGRLFSSGKARSVLVIACNLKLFDKISSENDLYLLNSRDQVLFKSGSQSLTDKTLKAIQKDLEKNQSTGNTDEGNVPDGFYADGSISDIYGICMDKGERSNGFAYRTLGVNDWVIVARISDSENQALYIWNIRILLAILFLVLIVVIIMTFLWDHSIISPILYLAQTMQHTNDLTVTKNKNRYRSDEIGILYRGYEEMLRRINRLVHEQYETKIQYLNYRLQSLMSQINNHFIFNTLASIESLAWISNEQKIATMAKALGDILRYSIDYETDEVTLQKEIDHVKKYLSIQEIKFENHISWTEEIEPELYKAKVPKFLFQPIIENAIEHGLASNLNKEWEIALRIYRMSDDLLIEITDNGSGMTESKLHEVQQRIQEPPEQIAQKGESIGLANVNQRIHLLYKDKYGLHIANQESGGVRIIIRLPYHV